MKTWMENEKHAQTEMILIQSYDPLNLSELDSNLIQLYGRM